VRKAHIYVIHYHEDDPRKCTALRMVRAGLAKLVKRPPRGSLLLDPYAAQPISPSDASILQERGLVVVDASWNKLKPQRIEKMRRLTQPRRLPFLIAANPLHYGKPYKLSSLEAVAAALVITGFREQAEELLSLYKWGTQFIIVNSRYLEMYAEASSPEDIMRAEAEILGRILGRQVTVEEVPRLIEVLAASG